jgi:hypothetical protein
MVLDIGQSTQNICWGFTSYIEMGSRTHLLRSCMLFECPVGTAIVLFGANCSIPIAVHVYNVRIG